MATPDSPLLQWQQDTKPERQWSAEQPPSSTPNMTQQLHNARTIWRGYLYGQLANVSKAALWWSTFGIVAVSMLDSTIALAVTRAPFNIALLFSSPLAVVAAEKLSIRSLLVATTSGRLLVWSLLIPLTWVCLWNVFEWRSGLWCCMILFMFVDGVQVAFSNAVDIDCGGLDSISVAYDLPLTDFLRYKFTTVHQLVFDSSFIFLTPPIIFLIMLLSTSFDHVWAIPHRLIGSDPSVFVLSAGIAVVFGLLSFISLQFYTRFIPIQPQKLEAETVDTSDGLWPESSQPPISLTTAYREKLEEVLDGLMLVMSDKALKWRLIMLAWETALEDSMVSVVIPMIALNSTSFLGNTNDKAVAALISVIIIAVGKLGGVLAGVYLASHWHQHYQYTPKASKLLFNLVLSSSLSLILLPWGFAAASHALTPPSITTTESWVHKVSQWIYAPPPTVSCGALLLGVFLFFIFSTAPKIGFASLIQNLVTQEDQAQRVFGFVGMFVTVVDGVMITLINLIFWYTGPERFILALWLVFGFYLAHGLFEWCWGGNLIKGRAQNSFA